ncbi:NADP-dependent oxidoreductase [Promicromonospora sp. NPDC050880]|uniref:NADP-dependent oxidoreductase n=1 Tax=Promicromonospora sp. NPDC050880 TaxID=3364406 RepID=UPI00378E02B5
MTSMRAVRFHEYGSPDVLRLDRVPVPVPGDGEVLVRVHAAGLGGGELPIRAGTMGDLLPTTLPQGIGGEFTGRVAAVGTAVSRTQVGQAVWGVMPHFTFGSAADYVAVPEDRLAPAPAGMSLIEAAALPSSGTTVLTALVDQAALRPGERLLVRGASGGAGSVAVQLGAALGAHVTALAGASSLAWVGGLGADETHDYRATRPADLGRFDVVLDLVGTDLETYGALVGPGGRFLPLALGRTDPAASAAAVLAAQERNPGQVLAFSNDPTRAQIEELTRYAESGAIRPYVDETFPLEQAAAAQSRLERGGVRGKIVLVTGAADGQ